MNYPPDIKVTYVKHVTQYLPFVFKNYVSTQWILIKH
jgi:hypothetical protein